MDKKKVLFVTNSFGMGGAEKVLIDIVNALSGQVTVHILAFHNRGALKEEAEKCCSVFTLFSSPFHFLIFRKIRLYRKFIVNRFLARHRYNSVVGFMEGKSTNLVAEMPPYVRKIAWVHTDFRKNQILQDSNETLAVYKNMESIIFVSDDARKAFLERFSGVNSTLRVIYNLIDEQKVLSMANAYNVEHPGQYTFLSVGMLRREKRHDRLVRIASRLKAQNFDFHLQIIGDGPLYAYLAKLVEAEGVQDYVELLGVKTNPYPYMRACDCFVLCSDYEGYGIALKEALFLKKLVVTTDVVGPREILADGRFGLIVENNEEALFQAMKHVLHVNRENRGMEVLRNVEKYSGDNENIRKQLIEFFTA